MKFYSSPPDPLHLYSFGKNLSTDTEYLSMIVRLTDDAPKYHNLGTA
jgi:hypothetical protein